MVMFTGDIEDAYEVVNQLALVLMIYCWRVHTSAKKQGTQIKLTMSPKNDCHDTHKNKQKRGKIESAISETRKTRWHDIFLNDGTGPKEEKELQSFN